MPTADCFSSSESFSYRANTSFLYGKSFIYFISILNPRNLSIQIVSTGVCCIIPISFLEIMCLTESCFFSTSAISFFSLSLSSVDRFPDRRREIFFILSMDNSWSRLVSSNVACLYRFSICCSLILLDTSQVRSSLLLPLTVQTAFGATHTSSQVLGKSLSLAISITASGLSSAVFSLKQKDSLNTVS